MEMNHFQMYIEAGQGGGVRDAYDQILDILGQLRGLHIESSKLEVKQTARMPLPLQRVPITWR